ncbi:glycosyl hydrolases family 31-domain-containing protein [Syncephalastrum racemosum]|uniref:Glycosyl hydrolases family 31-domain-containing protein n=1 Tax=Syncephalastrum racemosum TaxID=13706 RepID=A0A1X2HT52_SYNRA|nr:glycosyl hydrolases family 31-domain-containing protein [Syncephalastrum racemosum]
MGTNLPQVAQSTGLASYDNYIEPRLSIGDSVPNREFSTGHFKIQVDSEALALVIRNGAGMILWKSIHNLPFLLSSSGQDDIHPSADDSGVFSIRERDDQSTMLQTVTRIEKVDDETVRIYGGLGHRIVPPTHLDYELSLHELSQSQLQFSARIVRRDPSMANYRRLILTFESRSEECFYGFGESPSHINFKGHKVPVWIRENAQTLGKRSSTIIGKTYGLLPGMDLFMDNADRAGMPSHVCVPQFITSDRRCLFLENTEYSSFDMRNPDRVTIRVNADHVTGRLLYAASMLDLITGYTEYSGRMQTLPDWVTEGAIAGIQGGHQKVLDIVLKLVQHQVPLSAVWIPDWCGVRRQKRNDMTVQHSWWNWEADTGLYPFWPSFVDSLYREHGVRVLSYINPFLVDKPNARRNLYREAADNGYLVQNASSQPCRLSSSEWDTGLLDLSNPQACLWFKQVLKDQVWQDGVAGVMVDCGESMPSDPESIRLHGPILPSAFHNIYPTLWSQLNHEVTQELDYADQALCLYRSGFTQSPGNMSLLWTGDHTVSWDQQGGIKSALIGMLSAGFSGFSVNHCDIGGRSTVGGIFSGAAVVRSKELLLRWMELAAFTAAFRTHEGLQPELHAQFYSDEDTYTHFSHTAKLFKALSRYRKHLLQEAQEKGWPLMRHLALYYPEDPNTRELTHQFLLGEHLMVAPVLSPSTTFVKVYLPKESEQVSWRNIWTGKSFEADGKYKVVDTPLGQPAALIREPRQDGGLLNDLVDFANAASAYNVTSLK